MLKTLIIIKTQFIRHKPTRELKTHLLVENRRITKCQLILGIELKKESWTL